MFIPDSYKMVYSFSQQKKTFAEFTLQTAEKELLPDTIRLEKNNGYNSISGANLLLKIRDVQNWSKCKIAGLRPTGTPDFYYSDLPVNGCKSFVIVYISPIGNKVILQICKQFYPTGQPAYRERLANYLIELINKFLK